MIVAPSTFSDVCFFGYWIIYDCQNIKNAESLENKYF